MKTVQAWGCVAAVMAAGLWSSSVTAQGQGQGNAAAAKAASTRSTAQAQARPSAKPAPAKPSAATRADKPRANAKPRTAAGRAAPAKRPTARTAAPAVAAAKATPAFSDTESRLARAGDHSFTVPHGGLARSYRVRLPAGYHPATPAPLLVVLQGASREPGRDAQDLVRQAETQGFITVFPQVGARSMDGKAVVKAAWNAGPDRSADDVGFVAQVVANVFRQASVDRERIYAAGLAEGAAMASRLACDKPDVFFAVVAIGPTQAVGTCSPSQPISVLHFQAGGALPGNAPGSPDAAAQWAQLNGCAAAPRRILDIGADYCEAYAWCRGQAEVQRCVASEPAASKGKGGGTEGVTTISANDRLWAFLGRR